METSTGWNGRARRLMTVGAVAVALLASGCSGGSAGTAQVASTGGKGAKPARTADTSGKDDSLAYSKCMRAHGLTNFPDPDPAGGVSIDHGSGLDPNSPQFKAADAACKALMPPLSPVQQGKMRAGALKYSQCMRAHGLTHFPDPGSDGGLQIQATPGSELDPNNPLFIAADKACQKLMPPGQNGDQKLDQKSGPGGAAS